MTDVVVQRSTGEIRVAVGGGQGPRGLASGPLGAGSVDADTISDDAGEQAAVRAKLGALGSALGGATLTDAGNIARGSRYFGFGASLMANANATGETDHTTVSGQAVTTGAFPAIVRNALGMAVRNRAIGGAQVADQFILLANDLPVAGDIVDAQFGPNDQKKVTTAVQRTLFREQLRAFAVLGAGRKLCALATDSSVTTTGSWAASPGSIWPFGRVSNTAGATMTIPFFGSAGVLAMVQSDSAVYPSASSYRLRLDGVQVGVFAVNAAEAIRTVNTLATAPKAHFSGALDNGPHAWTVEVLTTGLGVEVGFAAGLNDRALLSDVEMFVYNCPPQFSGGYTDGGSFANVQALNVAIADEVALLASYGLPVHLVDIFSLINDGDFAPDGSVDRNIHFVNSGHAKVAAARLAAGSALANARDKGAARAVARLLSPGADGSVALRGLLRFLDGAGASFDPGGSFKLFHLDGSPIQGMREAYSSALLAEIYAGAGSGFGVTEKAGDGTRTSLFEVAHGGIMSLVADGRIEIGAATLLRGQRAVLPAAATDLAGALTLLNAIRTGLTASNATHGLFAAS